MAEFDPSRARPETVRELIEAPYASGEMYRAHQQLRSECLIPLRARAEVDAEIATIVRVAFGAGSVQVRSGAVNMTARIEALCDEPTSDSGPSSVDAPSADGPLPPSAPVSPAGAAYVPLSEIDLNAETRGVPA